VKKIPVPLTLSGKIVRLVSMAEHHFDSLLDIAGDRRIWEHYIYDGTDSKRLQELLQQALVEREVGTAYPFVIHHLTEDRLIGSSRFMDIQPAHRKLEIGTTWLQPSFWGTPVNLECKLLLLTYCFESLSLTRVQLKTDALNMRSRKAIEKIGARYEGILRHDMVRDNGTHRDSAYYSIIDHEWPGIKKHLTGKFTAALTQLT
jgi:RimJ/RimL family protein N-acetyltransferase